MPTSPVISSLPSTKACPDESKCVCCKPEEIIIALVPIAGAGIVSSVVARPKSLMRMSGPDIRMFEGFKSR